MKTKFYEIPNIISTLEHDGDREDTRLHFTESFSFFIKDRNKYELLEKKLLDFIIEKHSYNIFCSFDSSGYDYWMIQQEEGCRFSYTVDFKNLELDSKEIEELNFDLELIENEFSEYENIGLEDYLNILNGKDF